MAVWPPGRSAACGTQPTGRALPAAAIARHAVSTQDYVFVTNLLGEGETNSEIAYWRAGSTGNVPPAGAIYGSATGLDGPAGIVVNPAGEILVANSQTNAILGFAPGSNGNVAPNVVVSGRETRIDHPTGLAEDDAGNLFVSNCAHGCGTRGAPSIAEFAANANGNVAPIRVIQGRRTTLVKPHSLAVSRSGEIYVVDIGPPSKLAPHVEVFGADASGDHAPARVIEGGKTKLYHTGGGIALDPHGFFIGNWSSRFIERFAFLANGDARPRSFIRGSRTQLECCLDGLALSATDSLYAVVRASAYGSGPYPEVVQFGNRAHGNAPPVTNITGSNTGLHIPLSIFVGAQP
ncbi:MAG TPA: hypothetical protein VGX91_15305 [Candidatus Cybelea sp.]|nr:hypothetical protein [Candidatus Cybelea sp.]